MVFEPVIGLEVHVQLNTVTKIFCSCATRFGSPSNTQTCPVCLGLPGVLPVLNEEVLRKGVSAGLALNATIANYSKFDRKNYFYPDLPKAYQISQYDKPICTNGSIEITVEGKTRQIGITRLHLEEDAGKLIHDERNRERVSMVDLNRAGVPLVEIVSEPDLRSGDEAYEYLQKIKTVMKYIDASDVNMEEGSLRCDVNISVRQKGAQEFGQKVEIKNLNSFKAVRASINYEIERQIASIESGERIRQETRLWDDGKNVTYSMREKEFAHDYRYFPEPDLPPIVLTDEYIQGIRASLPELPDDRKRRFVTQYGLPEYDARVLTSEKGLADYFESAIGAGSDPKRASNWIMSEVLAVTDADHIHECAVDPARLAGLLRLIEEGTISGKIAKTVFQEMLTTGRDAAAIVEEKGLMQISDRGAIEAVIDSVIAANQKSVEDYKGGKEKALKFLIGQIMKETRGAANPAMVQDLLLQKLK
ncbi:MAG: Asp-tRNA(Asn)/Glu-tRNA(Gln) amidotransferase subunit GatB [Spirochaetes bacterium]|nr:Asp-tRNA(Asn)/Glu-tRNA(Gln) amidotransferase subunit GatB [Spirochaetota bacterium]